MSSQQELEKNIIDIKLEIDRVREEGWNEVLEHRKSLFETKMVLKHYQSLYNLEDAEADTEEKQALRAIMTQLQNVILDLQRKIDEENRLNAQEILSLKDELREAQAELREFKAQQSQNN